MDENSIEPKQAARIYSTVFPLINYLNRLQRRMLEVGFPPDDKLLGQGIRRHACPVQRVALPILSERCWAPGSEIRRVQLILFERIDDANTNGYTIMPSRL